MCVAAVAITDSRAGKVTEPHGFLAHDLVPEGVVRAAGQIRCDGGTCRALV